MEDQKRCEGEREREGRERIEDTERGGRDLNACWPLQMSIILCWQAEDHFEPSTRGLLLPSSLQKSHTHSHTYIHTHTNTQITERSLTSDSPIRGIKKLFVKTQLWNFSKGCSTHCLDVQELHSFVHFSLFLFKKQSQLNTEHCCVFRTHQVIPV